MGETQKQQKTQVKAAHGRIVMVCTANYIENRNGKQLSANLPLFVHFIICSFYHLSNCICGKSQLNIFLHLHAHTSVTVKIINFSFKIPVVKLQCVFRTHPWLWNEINTVTRLKRKRQNPKNVRLHLYTFNATMQIITSNVF